MRSVNLDVVVWRGGAVESRHRVHAAVVRIEAGRGAALVASAGDPALATYWRSCAKPFQVMPLVAAGGVGPAGRFSYAAMAIHSAVMRP